MVEFLAFSDFHAHNFRYGSTKTTYPDDELPGLYNSRLIDCALVLRHITQYAKEHEVKLVLFGGDLFHKRGLISTDVLNVVTHELQKLSRVAKIIMIPGNHDYGDRHGNIHSLRVFGRMDNMVVVEDVRRIDIDGISVVTVPYTDDPEVARARLAEAGDLGDPETSILLAHLGMQGARVGSDYVLVSDADVSSTDVPYKKFAACFFGHYHQHQQLFQNGWFIGATHQHTWGDSGSTRGFLHVTMDNGKVDFSQVETKVSKFITVQLEHVEDGLFRPSDFVRVMAKGECGSQPLPEARFIEILQEEEDTDSVVLEDTTLDVFKLLEVWVDHQASDLTDAEQKELVDKGKELLTLAMEDSL